MQVLQALRGWALSTDRSTWKENVSAFVLAELPRNPSLFANRSLSDENTETSCDPARRFLAPSGDLPIRLPGLLPESPVARALVFRC